MKKLFQYIIIRLTTRHATTAVKIFESLYQPKMEHPLIIFSNSYEGVTEPDSPAGKKQEVMDAIRYLKSKVTKTKQDKSSISMLEGVLGSMV
jgi:hypothetical protein